MAWAHSHPSPQGQEVRPRETLGVGDRTEQWMPRLWTNNYGPVLTEKVWRALKSRQAVPHGEEMCPIPLHIPKAIQSFPLNMDITAKESGEGNLRIASELREFTLNWLNNMWNWEVAQKANLQKSTLFLFLHIWIYGQKYLSFSTILYLKIQNKKPVSPQSYSPLKLSILFSLYCQTFGENGLSWGLCSLRSTYCLSPPHLTSGSRLINLLSNWSVIQKTIIELIPWVMTFPLSYISSFNWWLRTSPMFYWPFKWVQTQIIISHPSAPPTPISLTSWSVSLQQGQNSWVTFNLLPPPVLHLSHFKSVYIEAYHRGLMWKPSKSDLCGC